MLSAAAVAQEYCQADTSVDDAAVDVVLDASVDHNLSQTLESLLAFRVVLLSVDVMTVVETETLEVLSASVRNENDLAGKRLANLEKMSDDRLQTG